MSAEFADIRARVQPRASGPGVAGERSRDKLVRVEGISEAELRRALL